MNYWKIINEDIELQKAFSSLCYVDFIVENNEYTEFPKGSDDYNSSALAKWAGYCKDLQVTEVFATERSGGHFVYLDDGSIAFMSSESECGRIAENLEDFIYLVTFFPCFDWLYIRANSEYLQELINENASKGSSLKEEELVEYQQYIIKTLQLKATPKTLKKFYATLTRKPSFTLYCSMDFNEDEKWWPLFVE